MDRRLTHPLLSAFCLSSAIFMLAGCPARTQLKAPAKCIDQYLNRRSTTSSLSEAPYGEILGGGSTRARRRVLSMLWRKAVDPHYKGRQLTWKLEPEETASPTFDPTRGHLYVGAEQRYITSFEAKDGKLLWSKRLNGRIVSAPTFDDERVYVGTTSGLLYALERDNGKIVWKYQATGEILSQPAFVPSRTVGGKEQPALVLFTGSDNRLQAVSAEKGTWQWQVKHDQPEQLTIRGQAPPLVHKGFVYTGFSDGTVVAVRLDDNTTVWSRSIRENDRFSDVDSPLVATKKFLFASSYSGSLHALDIKTGKTIWKYKIQAASAVSINGNELFVSNPEGDYASLSVNSGKVNWKGRLKGIGALSAPVSNANYVFFSSSKRGLYIFDRQKLNTLDRCLSSLRKNTGNIGKLSVEKLHERYQQHAIIQRIRLQHGISSSPLLFGKRLFALTNSAKLYAFGLGR